MRAPDRLLPKPYSTSYTYPYNSDVDFGKYRILREVNYHGWVSIEDGLNGLEEIRESAFSLRSLMRA